MLPAACPGLLPDRVPTPPAPELSTFPMVTVPELALGAEPEAACACSWMLLPFVNKLMEGRLMLPPVRLAPAMSKSAPGPLMQVVQLTAGEEGLAEAGPVVL